MSEYLGNLSRRRLLAAAMGASGLGQADAGGSGLGLAIVKSIADMHRGGVTLDRSPRLGGLRAVVSFPVAPP